MSSLPPSSPGPEDPSAYPGQHGAGPYPGPSYGQQPNGYGGHHPGQYPGHGPGAPSGWHPGAGQYPGAGQVGADDPLVPRSFGEWVSKVIGVVARSWPRLLVLQIAATLPGLLVSGLSEAARPDPASTSGAALATLSVGLLAGSLVSLVIALLAQGASVFVAVRDAVGRPAATGEALSFAARRALPLLGWSLLAGLMLLVGYLLVVLPGIYLTIVFGAALTGVVLVERRGIGRMFNLVNPRFWPTAGRLLVFAVGAVVYSLVITYLVGLLTTPGVLASVLMTVLLLPASVAVVGVSVVTYAELRNHENPGVGAPALAAQMEA